MQQNKRAIMAGDDLSWHMVPHSGLFFLSSNFKFLGTVPRVGWASDHFWGMEPDGPAWPGEK